MTQPAQWDTAERGELPTPPVDRGRQHPDIDEDDRFLLDLEARYEAGRDD